VCRVLLLDHLKRVETGALLLLAVVAVLFSMLPEGITYRLSNSLVDPKVDEFAIDEERREASRDQRYDSLGGSGLSDQKDLVRINAVA